MMMRNKMVEVKIMASEKIIVMPLASDKCVCACIMCGGEAFSTSKKIDDFFMHFSHVTSLALSNSI